MSVSGITKPRFSRTLDGVAQSGSRPRPSLTYRVVNRRFRVGLVPLKRQPSVTIQKRGTISLNKAAEVALDCPKTVELLYDAERRVVGLRAVDQGAAPGRASTTRSGRSAIAVRAQVCPGESGTITAVTVIKIAADLAHDQPDAAEEQHRPGNPRG